MAVDVCAFTYIPSRKDISVQAEKVQHKYLLPYDAKDKYHNIDEKEKRKVKIKVFTTWFLLFKFTRTHLKEHTKPSAYRLSLIHI